MRQLHYITVFTLSSLLWGCGSEKGNGGGDSAKNPEIAEPYENTARRIEAGTLYPFVGIIHATGGRCSGTLLRHGLFITAKHCFKDQIKEPASFVNIRLVFSFSGEIDEENNLTITENQIESIVFDGTTSDIAYVLYESEITSDLDSLDTFPRDYLPNDLAEGEPLNVEMVGFPSQTGSLKRLITQNSVYTNVQKVNEVFPGQVTYDGITYDTNCWAWFGNSGGPVYLVDDSGKPIELLGVVSHTFDVNDKGIIPTSAKSEHEFGTYVKTANFSPMSQTLQLDTYLPSDN